MKNSFKTKALALALSVCMMLSLTVFTLIPASAADEVEGMWNTYGLASESDPDYLGEKKSVPGFEYTDDGFKMTTADWSTSSPFSQMSTTQKVDVKEGVYMEVRVDDFDYDASDKWFNFFLWSTPHIDEGAIGYGEGIQTIIRIATSTDEEVPGKLNSIAWYKEEFTNVGASSFEDPKPESFIVDGKNVLKFEVTYDGTTFAVNINGSKAPDRIIEYMNEHFAEDSMAYVGFAMLSSKVGGSQEATLLKFGTSAANAETPVSAGTDSKDAENHVYTFADPEDMEQPVAGQPAILMTGDIGASHLSNLPKSQIGGRVKITPDYTVQVGSYTKGADAGRWLVDSDTSYNIEDFPVVMCITKNFCACQSDDGFCYAFEQASAYVLTGDKYTAEPSNQCKGLEICMDPYVIGDDSYLYFWYDTSWNKDQFKGRINGTHFSFTIDLETVGANEFEVVLQAFFKTEADAEAYAEAYFESLGWSGSNKSDYRLGYNSGVSSGDTAGQEAGYTDGFGGTYGENYKLMDSNGSQDSYTIGYVDGYNSAFSRSYENSYSQASYEYQFYLQGYNKGHDDGFDEGYTEGLDEGFDEGFDEGYNEGYTGGFGEGHNVGFEEGRNFGYDDGYKDGYDDGYKDGCDRDNSEGTEDNNTEADETEVTVEKNTEATEENTENNKEIDTEDYEKAYNDGYEKGYGDGHNVGYNKGYVDGSKQSGGNDETGGGSGNGSYQEGYKDGYSDAVNEMSDQITSELKGCENSIGGAAIILLTAIPAAFFIFKRKKDD